MNAVTLLRRLLLALTLALPLVVSAKEAAPASDDPVLEAKVMRISAELRCLVCQNQTIADSHADLAQDLRGQVREMLRQGKSEAQILDYMTQRYGDFVLYRPPVKSTTTLLWYGPAALLIGGVIVLIVVLRRRSKLPDDRFEPDAPDEAEPSDAPAR
ncbi:MAG: cytochrome c-type biogenesis protein [Piscinibacter sp.]|uniref:cytochrome c-type biogenesis protein n=1 Tax=Piscinibacter sp. TaxID=1903157 RepID=UPI003D0E61F6